MKGEKGKKTGKECSFPPV